MQNVNKFGIGAPVGNQQQQQENNYRTSSNLVAPLVRTESGWSRQSLQVPVQTASSCQDNDNRSSRRLMSYLPAGERARGFRTVRDEDRDDAYAVAGRDGMIEWHSGHAVGRNESAFTNVSYRAENQQSIPRAPEQFEWRRVPEREWRRHAPMGVLREARSMPREHVQVSVAAATRPWTSSNTGPAAAMAFQQSATWSRTVAQVNSHNHQLLQTRSGRGGSHAHHHSHREVQQVISLSSSTGSSTASGSCRSPDESNKVGFKRLGGTLDSPQVSGSFPDALASQKRLKPTPPPKPAKFDMLNLLANVTNELGALQENPSGCSCPKSKCIALYCDCFKAGRRCSPGTCSCLSCKNTVDESGINGARTVAIRTILARNPRAFTTAGFSNPPKELSPGQVACNCIRSRCLKLYCGCFQAGNVCDPTVCTCISCLNTEEDAGGHRQSAIQQCLEKRPNAFQVRPREAGMGCACKNNRCIRKYCECFRTGLSCTEKCVCRSCENMKKDE